MNNIDVFNPENAQNFETLSHQNGNTFWLASDYAKWMDYSDFKSFKKAIGKAIGVCVSLDINVTDNFHSFTHIVDGESIEDYKLTRFACYLTAMNSDIKKKPVAKAQVYFASLAEIIRQNIENADNVERVVVRQEVTDQYKSLSRIANSRQVVSYANFMNAGYMGMYNMGIDKIRQIKGIGIKDSPFDFMGKRELAANLFRITETEGRIIKDENIKGQKALEKVAYDVGVQVRGVMEEKPETLVYEQASDIKKVKSNIRRTKTKMDQLDKPKKKP